MQDLSLKRRKKIIILSIILVALITVPATVVCATVYVFDYSGVTSTVQSPSVALEAGTAGSSTISSVAADAATITATAGVKFYEFQNAPVTGCTSPCLTTDTQLTQPNTVGTLGLDGTPETGTWSSGTSFTISSITTTDSQDVIVLWIVTYKSGSSITVSSVSDSASDVTWQTSARQSIVACSSTTETTQTEWYGITTTALSSDTITVTLSGTPTAASGEDIAISGANTAQPFDTASLPQTATAACTSTKATPETSSTAVSTNNANDFVFASFGSDTAVTETAGKIGSTTTTLEGTISGSGDSLAVEYLITSSKLSSTSCAFGTTTTYWGVLCDAIVQASGSFSLPASSSMYLWSPEYSSTTSTSIYSSTGSFTLYNTLPTPSVDGSPESGTWSSGTSFTITSVTTSGTSDVIILSIQTYKSGSSITVSSVSDSASEVSWASSARNSFASCSGADETTHTEWYGTTTTALSSDTITIDLSGTPTEASGIEVTVSGVNIAAPFDTNSGLPDTAVQGSGTCSGTSSSPTVSSVSTSQASDLVVAIFGSHTSVTQTAGSIGGTTGTLAKAVAGTGYSNAVEYRAVTSTQSSISCAFGTSTTYWGVLCDAIAADPITVTVSLYTTNSAGTVQSTLASSVNMNLANTGSATLTITSSSGSVPASGYVELQVSTPSSAGITVLWGSGTPTTFNTPDTYNYILAINNPTSSSYSINFGVASSSNLGRLTSGSISFLNPSSTQITISSGSITQSTGPTATLSASSTADIEIVVDSNILPTSTNTPSTVVLSLKLQASSSSSYAQYTLSLTIN